MAPLIQVKPLRTDDGRAIIAKLAYRQAEASNIALNQIGAGILSDLEGITNDWNHRVAFKVVRTRNTVKVTTDDRIFGWVDRGTAAHTIQAKPGKRLVFQAGYAARTRPNNTVFRGSGKSFGPVVRAKVVHHPGSKPRNITRIFQAKWTKEGVKIFKQALKQTFSRR